ncbi:MAG: TetR/AcrR family transcriptional regulator [Acidimicrobiia bacterium]
MPTNTQTETVPQGRVQVVTAILDACEHLSERTVPSAFTIVDLAREAKITTSLLYFYFDSKDAIVAATLQRFAEEADAGAGQFDDPAEMVDAARRLLWRRPAFSRIITSMWLEGTDITELMGNHPFLQRLMTAEATRHPEDPETHAGRAVIDLLATSVFGPAVNNAMGRELYDPRIAGIEEAP